MEFLLWLIPLVIYFLWVKTDKKFFVTKTAITLWRLGNAGGPRMTHLRLPPRPEGRRPDITPVTEFVNGTPVQFVLPNTGGISLYDAIHPGLSGDTWYEIPAMSDIPPGLIIEEDEKDPQFDVMHYTVAPQTKMTLQAFIDLLDIFGKKAEARFERNTAKK